MTYADIRSEANMPDLRIGRIRRDLMPISLLFLADQLSNVADLALDWAAKNARAPNVRPLNAAW
jgi:hypothetical protein